MAHDAIERSLSASDPSLERQVNDLNLIVNHLLARINDTRDEVGANGAKIDRCMALAASATTRAELAIKNAEEAVPAARDAALDELLRIAEAANDGPRHAEPKRRCKRKLPPGWAGLVTGISVAFGVGAGVLKAHRAAAAVGAAALMMAASAPIAGTLLPDADARTVAPAPAHHFRARRDLDPATGAVPARRGDRDTVVKSVHRERAPSPKGPAATGAATPPPSPVPSPAGSTLPAPSPAATPPVPTPAPTGTGILAAAWDH